MEQEIKINAKEIMARLRKLQSDVHYIKKHINVSENRACLINKFF